MKTLDALDIGSEATLLSVGGPRGFRCRLMELGLLPGTRVRLVRRNDAQGVLELEVRSSHLSLRTREAGLLSIAVR